MVTDDQDSDKIKKKDIKKKGEEDEGEIEVRSVVSHLYTSTKVYSKDYEPGSLSPEC